MTMKHSGSTVSVAGDSRITTLGAKLRHLPPPFRLPDGFAQSLGSDGLEWGEGERIINLEFCSYI